MGIDAKMIGVPSLYMVPEAPIYVVQLKSKSLIVQVNMECGNDVPDV
jgi:hypothetical protein